MHLQGILFDVDGTVVPDLFDAREMRPFAGVTEHLRTLHRRGIKLALASSSNPDEVKYYSELLGVGGLLEASASKKDAEISKQRMSKSW